MKNLKPANVPILVVIYACVLAVFGVVLGIRALIDPSTAVSYIEGADAIASAWAGRTLGLGLAMGLAIYFRSASVYTAVFLGCVCREFGDIVGMFNSGSTPTLIVLAVFFVLDVLGLVFSGRAAKRPLNHS